MLDALNNQLDANEQELRELRAKSQQATRRQLAHNVAMHQHSLAGGGSAQSPISPMPGGTFAPGAGPVICSTCKLDW